MTRRPRKKARREKAMAARSRLQPPEPTLGDKLVSTTRTAGAAALGSGFPIVGDVVAAILGDLFPAAYQRRCAAWRADVTRSLNELAAQGIRVEELRNNEEFIDLVIDATTIAIRTGSARKRKCLQNAIINAGSPTPPDVAKQRLFVRLVDELDELHLGLLSLFHAPGQFFRNRGMSLPIHDGPTGVAYDPTTSNASLKRVLDLAFPGYAGEVEFLDTIVSELNRRGLIASSELFVPCRDGNSFTSAMGKEFLRFVTKPLDPSASGRS